MDHKHKAEELLSNLFFVTTEQITSAASAHAILALCDRLDDISCIVAIPVGDDDEE